MRSTNGSPLFECLENRQLLSTYMVTNNSDAGAGTLRQAVLDANNAAGADVIQFDGSLSGATIRLATGELRISDDLTITGLGENQLTISGNYNSRVFSNAATTSISGLTIMEGVGTGGDPDRDGDGGGIYNTGALTLTNTTVKLNNTTHGGGGIYNASGALTLANSTVSNNYGASGGGIINVYLDGGQNEFGGTVTLTDSIVSNNESEYGGGIWSSGTVTLTDSTVSDNQASRSSGGVYNAFGTLTMTRSTISGNTAINNGGGVFNSGDLTVTGSTISDNSANHGGGLYNAVGTVSLTGTLFSTNSADTNGGGIYTRTGGTVTLSNSVLSDNSAGSRGGGTHALESTLILVNATFSGNTAAVRGGGIASYSSTLTLQDSSISDNHAGSGGGVSGESGSTITGSGLTISGNAATFGGGIDNSGAVTLTNSTVSDNTASQNGGAIYSTGGEITLANTTISGNTAGNNGGGIDNFATLTLANATVSDNTASYGGGILNWGMLTLTNSTIEGNTASNSGGGIYNGPINFPGTLSITNSTVSGNTAQDGGGIYSGTGTLTMKNSTISGNTGSGDGGGLFNYDSTMTLTNSTIAANLGGGGLHLAGGTATLRSVIVAGNTDGDVLNGTLHPSSSHNLIKDAASAGGLTDGVNNNLIGVDPLLGALADNGGPTKTHALLAFSPAINAGSNSAGLSADQRGALFVRAFDGAPDIGAFERQSLALLVSTTADEVDGDYSFGEFSLREAIELANTSPGHDDIGFDVSLTGTTIALGEGQLEITDNVTITGLGADHLTVSDSVGGTVFYNNATQSSISGLTMTGGGSSAVYNREGTLTLIDSMITDSTAEDGGGIFNYRGTVTVTGSTISGNTATNGGGGIFNFQGTLVIDNSVITDNAGANGGGGGILSTQGTLTITDSTISGNTAFDGGGIHSFGGTLTVIGSTIEGNSAPNAGGGIANSGGPAVISNSTISGNTAGASGGGIDNDGSALAISNSTIAFNTADADGDGQGQGGGINFGNPSNGDTLTTTSSMYAGNWRGGTALIPDDIAITEGKIVGSHNLVQDAATAGGLAHNTDNNLVGVDPLLSPLAANGGANMTHALLPGSPAHDAGSNPDALDTDQRGFARARGDAPDIGAFEATARPDLDSLGVAVSPIIQGRAPTLIAEGVTDADGSIAGVRFYHDANRDGVAQESELLGTDSDGSDGFSLTLTAAQTADLALVTEFFLAQAVDDEGFLSDLRAYTATVIYSHLAGTGAIASSSSTSDDTLWTGVVNLAGDVILFESATGTSLHLGLETGAPKATGDVTVFTDAKDGLVYAVYPSAEGLILAQHAEDGAWTIRNLTTEAGIQTDNGPTHALTQFTTTNATGQIIVIAGIDASGNLVGFQQTGDQTGTGLDWTFIDISADLASQGMTTPVFTELISYVTPWNAWTLAGIDGDGNIQSVWVAPASFTTWRIDNLSNITGAPPISGQLTVTQTSWRAINLGGVDSDGSLVVTWWVPSFGGDWVTSDLTGAASGETLAAGKATGFVTPWGAINYAGINAAGDVTVYWWTPQTGGWVVTPLTGNLTGDRPAGSLTSHVSAAGTMSVLGTTDEGEITRLWWAPDGDGSWKLDNLSDGALRA